MKVRRLLSVFLFVCLSLAVTGPAISQDNTVYARVSNWEPAYWKKDGRWVGMDIEFYKALEKASGLSFIFVEIPWSRALHSLENGSCTIMAELSKTLERETYMHFLGPYSSEEIVVVVHKDNADLPIRSLDDLVKTAGARGLKIGIEENTFYGREFQLRMETDPGFKKRFQYAHRSLVEMVARKRLFGVFDQKVIVAHKIRTRSDYGKLAIHDFVVNDAPIYFGVTKKTSPEKIAKLKHACETLRRNGTFKKIEAKWKNN